MAHLLRSYPNTSIKFCTESSTRHNTLLRKKSRRINLIASKESHSEVRGRNLLVQSCSSSTSPAGELGLVESEATSPVNGKTELEYLASEYGWKVRRLARIGDEIREAARVQAEAFHEPAFIFNDFFFAFFQVNFLLLFFIFWLICIYFMISLLGFL